MRRRWLIPAGLLVLVLLPLTVCSPNRLDLLMSRGFFIPAESDEWQFRVTGSNSGSGEWWLYGEDDSNYYALDDHSPNYWLIAKGELPPGADPLDRSGWGSAAILRPIPD